MAAVFLNAAHGPLWLFAHVCALTKLASTKMVTFAMCAFGAPWQKATTLMYTAGLDAWLDVLSERGCEHSTHEKIAGGDKSKVGWNSNEAAAYPPDFNSYLAQAAAELIWQRRASISAVTPAIEEVDVINTDVPTVASKVKVAIPAKQPPLALSKAPAATSKAPAETLGDKLTSANNKIEEALAAADNATSIRQLSFADENIAHEEPDDEELYLNAEPPKAPRKKVVFEKTAGARSTRSQNPQQLRGLGTSAGFAMMALGASLSSAVYAMGTIDARMHENEQMRLDPST